MVTVKLHMYNNKQQKLQMSQMLDLPTTMHETSRHVHEIKGRRSMWAWPTNLIPYSYSLSIRTPAYINILPFSCDSTGWLTNYKK